MVYNYSPKHFGFPMYASYIKKINKFLLLLLIIHIV